ncbi:polysaccharide deacetylase family protein [Dactylosporangium sp. NPDC000555]|uniref:polysaccharide deacetylase family protein n=1 Tax=Dactylosporangium sp. NPDC000555 TaxID=3154260 RepID=UPI00332158A0
MPDAGEAGRELIGTRIPFRDRRGLQAWPNGAKMAVLVYTAPEEWAWPTAESFHTPGTLDFGQSVQPLSSRTAVSYGYNVGLYRLAEIFERFSMKVTLWTNGTAVEQHEQVLRDLVEAGHHLGGHAYSEGTPLNTLTREGQRESIQRTIDLIAKVTGTKTRGWIGPGAVCTRETIDLLMEMGFDYHCDLQDDELPYFLTSGEQSILEIPYRMVGNVNDFPLFTRNIQSVKAGVRHLCETFDAYRQRAEVRPLLFNYGTHPFVSGRPDFSVVLEEFLEYVHSFSDVWVCNYDQICDWWTQSFTGHADLVSAPIEP